MEDHGDTLPLGDFQVQSCISWLKKASQMITKSTHVPNSQEWYVVDENEGT